MSLPDMGGSSMQSGTWEIDTSTGTPTVTRAPTDPEGFVCPLCTGPLVLETAISVECMRAFGAARNAAATCLPDFQSCVSKELCPKPAGGPGTPVAEAHTKCREAFCAQFYLRIAGISPHLHCCWSIATVLQSLGLDPTAQALSSTATCSMPCVPCLTSLGDLFKALTEFRRRAEEQHAMMAYLYNTVWPEVPADRQRVLRTVLHGPPFKIRSPQDLVQQGRKLLTQVLACVDAELKKRGQPIVSPTERALFVNYVEANCERKSENDEGVFDTPSSVYHPATKKRIVDE